jgi:hypothetical protein
MLNEAQKMSAYIQLRQGGLTPKEAIQAIEELEFEIFLDLVEEVLDEMIEELEQEIAEKEFINSLINF